MTVHGPVSAPVVDALPEWRLDDLYAGPRDPRLEEDLEAAVQVAAELAKLKGQFAAARAQPERLGLLLDKGLILYERLTNLNYSVAAYAALAASVARDDPAWAKFEAARAA